ncbi:unnamed protein product [Prunus armeniaca]
MEVNTPTKEDDLDAFSPEKVGEGSSTKLHGVANEQVVNPFKYEASKPIKQVATPASGLAKSTGSSKNEAGKRNALAKDSKLWVFKKPLKDITNAKLEKNSTVGSKPGVRSNSTGKARGGHTRSNLNVGAVGMQVRGSNVQDDVQGLFLFNMDAASLPADFQGANVMLHEPEPYWSNEAE